MASGEDGGEPEDGKILSPEELDIAEDEHVREIEDGRYVVSSEVLTEDEPAAMRAAEGDSEGSTDSPTGGGAGPLDEAAVHEWLREDLLGSDARYGFDLTAAFDGRVDDQRMVSNDIVTVFETMLLWYARQVDSDTPVEEVLGILLMESNVPVRYPAESLQALVDSVGVEEGDTVGAMLRAVDEQDGVQL